MPAPANCIVSGIIYDANGAPRANTSVVLFMPQQVINQVSVISSQVISTQTNTSGAISPIALPQTAVIQVTVSGSMTITGIVPAAATGDISALLTGTVFASPLSGATVQANGVNLASQLLINFIGGDGAAVANPSGGVVTLVSRSLFSAASQLSPVSGTTNEIPVFAGTLGGNILRTLNVVQIKILLRIGLLNGSFVTIKCYYGTVLGPSLILDNASGVTAGLTLCPLLVTLQGNGATNQQNLIAECNVTGSQSNVANAFGSITPCVSQAAAMSIDSTLNKAIQVNVAFNSADALNQVDALSSFGTVGYFS